MRREKREHSEEIKRGREREGEREHLDRRDPESRNYASRNANEKSANVTEDSRDDVQGSHAQAVANEQISSVQGALPKTNTPYGALDICILVDKLNELLQAPQYALANHCKEFDQLICTRVTKFRKLPHVVSERQSD